MSQVDQSVSRISRRRQAALSEGGAGYSAKRAELLRVAAEVFREKGFAGATLNDVAARFGTDRASLYYYVASKEELFQETIAGVLTENLRKAETIHAQDLPAREKLSSLIAVVIGSQAEHYPYMQVYIQEDMRQVVSDDTAWASEMVEQTHRMERLFIGTIAEGIESGEFTKSVSPTLASNALFGMMMWTHRWWTPGKKYTPEDLADAFTKIFLDGVESDD